MREMMRMSQSIDTLEAYHRSKRSKRVNRSTYVTGDPVLFNTKEVAVLFIKMNVRELGFLQQFRIESPL